MSQPLTIPAVHARSLVATIDAIRGETMMLKAAGMLGVCADDLLDGSGTINAWLADLDEEIRRSGGASEIMVPAMEAWALQHLVYGLSSVLVWAHESRRDGRIATSVSAEALAAWAEIEQAAGLGGRTTIALGWSASRLRGRELHLPSGVEELEQVASQVA